MASVRAQIERAYREKVQRKLQLGVSLLAIEAFSRVVQRSPVDSGRFRANWQLQVGTKPLGTVQGSDPASIGSPPSAGALNAAVAEAQRLGPQLGVIYVTNNLPYARRLENGHSQQAPAGMVEVVAQELRIAAKQVIAGALRG